MKAYMLIRAEKYKVYVKKVDRVKQVQTIDFANKTLTWVEHEDLNETQPIYTETFEDVILLPYTGFKDASGNEIYKGDIVERNQTSFTLHGAPTTIINHPGVIIFDKKENKYFIEYLYLNELYDVEHNWNRVRVVGNFYDRIRNKKGVND